jgi:hypothetical protein
MKPGIQEFREQVAYLAGMTAGKNTKSSDEWYAVVEKCKWLTGVARAQLDDACERESDEAQKTGG